MVASAHTLSVVPENVRFAAAQVAAFEQAYRFFNGKLFGGELPMCFITLHRKSSARGYFMNDAWRQKGDSAQMNTHELAMNPDTFAGRSDKAILSTLVHEMAHCWQQVYGKPGRGGYHNKQWARKMIDLGLHPTATGEIGGKQTGSRMTHVIIQHGAFDVACDLLLESGWTLEWASFSPTKMPSDSSRNKVKYTCACNHKVWGKPALNIICPDCTSLYKEVS
jgi:predicted SprT family Zn-dependent metalloprotease